MRSKVLILLIILVLFVSCFEFQSSNEGTLRFRTSLNGSMPKMAKIDTLSVVDLIWYMASFEVSKDSVVAGAPDDLEWINVYSDTLESRLTEFNFEAELEAGVYKSIRMAMRNRAVWALESYDSLIYVTDYNRDGDPEAIPYSYHTKDGRWYCDDGSFELMASNETVSNIVAVENDVVSIVMNWYLSELVLDDSLNILDWIISEGHDMIEWDVISNNAQSSILIK